MVGGAGGGTTVTVYEHEIGKYPWYVEENVYVVVVFGYTVIEPG